MATRQSNGHPCVINLAGQKFGLWTVVERDTGRPYTKTRKTTYWICRCDCGTVRSLRGQHLRKGDSTSCGCAPLGNDLLGQTFGRLTVLERAHSRNGKLYWLCRCECGEIKPVVAWGLTNGTTTSCGCFHREQASISNTTHGQSHTIQYHSWAGMVQRCTNPNQPEYHNYGGRGIYVCERWLASSSNFLEDMGPMPSKEHSIDRINNNGNYTCGKCQQCQDRDAPANCRWATRLQQSCNRRTNRRLAHDGKFLTIKEWSLITGIKQSTIGNRLKLGWSVSLALTTVPRAK